MAIIDSFQGVHWRTFNVLTRLLGLGMLCVAGLFLSLAFYLTLSPEFGKNLQTAGFSPSVIYAVGGAFAGLLGFLFVRVGPYRPDLGDRTWSFVVKRQTPEQAARRNWWTGEPRG